MSEQTDEEEVESWITDRHFWCIGVTFLHITTYPENDEPIRVKICTFDSFDGLFLGYVKVFASIGSSFYGFTINK
jgi:hypothetical protein